MSEANSSPNIFARAARSDIAHSFFHSPAAMVSAFVAILLTLAAILAPLLAPQNPFDLATLDLMDARTPPRWLDGADPRFLLGSDNQGRDMLSAVLYGARISIGVSVASVVLAMLIGVSLGLIAGYRGGFAESLIMRAADVQLTFPAILTALLISGAARALLDPARADNLEFWILIVSIGLSFWVQYARTVRASTLVERAKDYVAAAKLIGVSTPRIIFTHILPNTLGPVLVIATINLALAIITEATLSFLGVGLPPSQPSLGTLVRSGNDFLMSGEWWIVFFPGAALAALALSVNVLGDWLRDALNPRLR